MKPTYNCDKCNITFQRNPSSYFRSKKHLCTSCRFPGKVKIVCLNCKKQFDVFNVFRSRKFCSNKCYWFYNKGEQSIRFKGRYKRPTNGYIYVWSPNHPNTTVRKYMLEHRLVMEKKIGRLLTKKEIVHHLNGIREDNRPENLALLSNQAEHRKEGNTFNKLLQERIKELEKLTKS